MSKKPKTPETPPTPEVKPPGFFDKDPLECLNDFLFDFIPAPIKAPEVSTDESEEDKPEPVSREPVNVTVNLGNIFRKPKPKPGTPTPTPTEKGKAPGEQE